MIDHRRAERDNFALMDNNGPHVEPMNNAQLHGINFVRWISFILTDMLGVISKIIITSSPKGNDRSPENKHF